MQFKHFSREIFKPYRTYIFLLFITGLFWGLYITVSPYLLKIVIDSLANGNSVKHIYLPAICFVVMYAIACLNFRFMDWVKYKILPVIKKDIALRMFNYIKLHSFNFYQNNFAGSMSNKVSDMIANLESLLNIFDEFFANICAFIFAIIVMYTVSPIFSIALLCWCVIFFIISTKFSKNIYSLAILTSESYSKYSGSLVDVLTNIASVRLFAKYKHETNNLNIAIDDLVKKDKNMLGYIIKMRLIQDATFVSLLSIMFYILLKLYSINKVTIGDFALILTITISIFQAMWYFAFRIIDVYKSLGKCQQAMSIMQIEHEVKDKENAKELVINQGEIEFKNVNFAYQNSPQLFKNLNVKIKPGTKVGLVGYSGSGKTTFISLILRYFEVNSGHIKIDKQDINNVTQDSLRNQISMIPQDISLFHRSLYENIRYGNTDASDDEIIKASKLAHCHEFIKNLENGYETLVGERGIKLSGGQRQRIAIARAFLENSQILVLDEATSSLDSVTEKYIQDSLQLATANRTTIIVAHRLSTLLEVDRILVFKNGEIIEDGSHQSLVESNGHYAKMWSMQCNGFLPDVEI